MRTLRRVAEPSPGGDSMSSAERRSLPEEVVLNLSSSRTGLCEVSLAGAHRQSPSAPAPAMGQRVRCRERAGRQAPRGPLLRMRATPNCTAGSRSRPLSTRPRAPWARPFPTRSSSGKHWAASLLMSACLWVELSTGAVAGRSGELQLPIAFACCPSVLRSPSRLRFQCPLIELDVRLSRIWPSHESFHDFALGWLSFLRPGFVETECPVGRRVPPNPILPLTDFCSPPPASNQPWPGSWVPFSSPSASKKGLARAGT
jgi:hypothetical protein